MEMRKKVLAPTAALSLLVLAWIVFIHRSLLQNTSFQSLQTHRAALPPPSRRWRRDDLHFFPVKNGSNNIFISQVPDTNRTGVPEFFYFNTSASSGTVLCLRGNSTRNGSENSYAFAGGMDRVPLDALVLPGTTLISDSHFDFVNPWHAMYNLIQFVHWRVASGCHKGDRMLAFHLGEIRHSIGSWINSVLASSGVTTSVDSLKGVESEKTVCFERAVMSRRGIGGVSREVLRDLFGEVRCQARRWCGIGSTREDDTSGVRIGLVIREGGRSFENSSDWKKAVETVCETQRINCSGWSVVQFSKLDFCGQVKVMSTTDVLVSIHGAQLTNMIFMNPGSRILEVFPRGWLALAGHGQFIYKHLADWAKLEHKGYWRDDEGEMGVECPVNLSPGQCFGLYYKNKAVGINSTFIVERLTSIVLSFSRSPPSFAKQDMCRC